MNIDLENVYIKEQSFDMEVVFPDEFFNKTSIIRMEPIHFKGSINKDSNQDYYLSFTLSGNIYLEDARTLEEVPYPISCNFEEKIDEMSEFCGRFLKNNQNTLDILSILWENIILEIPISYTLSEEDLSRVDDDASTLDDDNEVDPRLAPLLGLISDEKEWDYETKHPIICCTI